MVILAREMGLRVELSAVAIERLVPDALAALSLPEFFASLPSLDAGAHCCHQRSWAPTGMLEPK